MSGFTVFFDTNSIIANKYNIIPSQLLARYIKSGLVEVLMTEVVRDELIKHFAIDYQGILERLEKEHAEARRLGVDLHYSIESNNFEQKFEEIIRENNIKIVPIELASVRSIYSKAFHLKKPFKNKQGKESGGIKDAIVWESMVNYLSNNTHKDKIVFVCNDSDFINHSASVIHEELQSELLHAGIDVSTFFIAKSIQDLISLILEPGEELTEQQQAIQHELYSTKCLAGISLSELALEHHGKHANNAILEMIEKHVDFNGGVEIENIDVSDCIDVKVTHVRFLGPNVVYVFFSLLLKISFEYMGTRDALSSSNTMNMKVIDHVDFGESGWEPIIEETGFVSCDFEASLDTSTGNVISIQWFEQLNKFASIETWNQHIEQNDCQ